MWSQPALVPVDNRYQSTTGTGPDRRDGGLEQPDPESDITWWASRARDGDRQAIESLIRRSYARVLALCQARLLRRVDAEDAAQEVFVRAIRGLAEIRAPEAVGGGFEALRCMCVQTCCAAIAEWQRCARYRFV